MTTTFIVTAGGLGRRMSIDVPKQFILINGKPILMHTLLKLYSFNPKAQFILTLPSEWFKYWEDLCLKYNFELELTLVEGGKERFHSIQKAIKFAKGDVIAIHDGVRPLVSNETLDSLMKNIIKYEAVIPVFDIKESVRLVSDDKSEPINRNSLKIVQTPQVFAKKLIQSAYEIQFSDSFTDDASVVEKLGVSIKLVQGNEENIKITTASDLKIATFLLSNNGDV